MDDDLPHLCGELRALTERLHARNIHLSSYGNCAGAHALESARDEYRQARAHGSVAFDVHAVRALLPLVLTHFERTRSYDDGISSYEARGDIAPYVGYAAHGDVLAALLLAAFDVRFSDDDTGARVAARFNPPAHRRFRSACP